MKITNKQFNTIAIIVATMLVIELIKLATFI
jgi:hypothetical protein